VKLLFDENLSENLARCLADIYPGSVHVRDIALKGAEDRAIWTFAAASGFAIVTKDEDFREISIVRGAPPKVVTIGLGNCTTTQIEALLREKVQALQMFEVDGASSLLEIS
jgi:predicted nuclease of predicted toxin-antitoxin system